jgi:hypothetical protein
MSPRTCMWDATEPTIPARPHCATGRLAARCEPRYETRMAPLNARSYEIFSAIQRRATPTSRGYKGNPR